MSASKEYTHNEIIQEFYAVIEEAFYNNDVAIIIAKYNILSKSNRDLKTLLDQAFRNYLLDLLNKKELKNLESFMDLTVKTCKKDIASNTLPVILLSDIFETLTLEKCEIIFEYVEKNVHIWKEDLFSSSCKNNILRICNDLLRRLSRTQKTVFCGRILLFLAKFFPFSERSGLNIISEFNLENITQFDTEASSELSLNFDTGSSVGTSNIINFNLYRKMWSLQDFFRNPNQCYDKNKWKIFQAHSMAVLDAFKSIKIDYDEELNSSASKDFDCTMEVDSTPTATYFPKYLTNQKLLPLQMADSNFRRSKLIQFLIIFQYLPSTVKFKPEHFVLNQDQLDWIRRTTEIVYNLLRETHPDSDKFLEIVNKILEREKRWSAWKNEGCKEFQKPVFETTEDTPERKKVQKPKKEKKLLGDIIKEAHAENKYDLGSAEMTKLWNICPDNLEACKSKDRDFMPSLEIYFAEAVNNLISKEEGNKKIYSGNFSWKALRLLARRSPHFFTYSNVSVAKLQDYLEVMVKKVAKDQLTRGLLDNPDSNHILQDNAESNQMEIEELLKAEDEQETAEVDEEQPPKTVATNLTKTQLQELCAKFQSDWKKLGTKIGFKKDELEYFEEQNATPVDRATAMLEIWFGDDQDATLENLAYILEGLNFIDAAEFIKTKYL